MRPTFTMPAQGCIPAHRRSGPGCICPTMPRLSRSALSEVTPVRITPSLLHDNSFSCQSSLPVIPGVIFDASLYTPSNISIPVHVAADNTTRFPPFESILGTEYRLCECTVHICDEFGVFHKFLIVYQTGRQGHFNQALHNFVTNAVWKGSMVVIRCDVLPVSADLQRDTQRNLVYRAVKR